MIEIATNPKQIKRVNRRVLLIAILNSLYRMNDETKAVANTTGIMRRIVAQIGVLIIFTPLTQWEKKVAN